MELDDVVDENMLGNFDDEVVITLLPGFVLMQVGTVPLRTPLSPASTHWLLLVP